VAVKEAYKEYSALYKQLKSNPHLEIIKDNEFGILIREIDFLTREDIELIKQMNILHTNNMFLPIVQVQIDV